MSTKHPNRRRFLQITAGTAAAGLITPYFFNGSPGLADDAKARSNNDRPLVGCIGTGRWYIRAYMANKAKELISAT